MFSSLKAGIADLCNKIVSPISVDMLQNTAINAMQFGAGDADIVKAGIEAVAAPIAMTLMAVYLLMGIIEDAMNGKDIDIYDIVKPAIALVVADLLLTNIGEIVSAIMSLSNSFANSVPAALDKGDPFAIEAIDPEMIKETSLIGALLILLFSFIAGLLSIFASVALFVVCFTAKLEFLIRLTFCPIGFAGIAAPSQKHECIRYLKKLLASAFYLAGVLIAITMAIKGSQEIVNNIMTKMDNNYDLTDPLQLAWNMLQGLLMIVGAPFAAVGAVTMVKSAINEAFGGQ